jgi:Na+(H+)/acetate symporter ActP
VKSPLSLFVIAISCCFFGVATLFAAVVVGDSAAAVVTFFTVFGILHIRDSVVLTTFRVGLLGSHISALSLGDIVVVLSELPVRSDDDNCCCPYTTFADKIVVNANNIVITATTSDLVRGFIVGSHSDALHNKYKIDYCRRKIKRQWNVILQGSQTN